MSKSELLTVGLKLLGVYFLIESIAMIWQHIGIIGRIIYPYSSHSGQNSHDILFWLLPSIGICATWLTGALLLLFKTKFFVRLCRMTECNDSETA